MYIYLYNNYEYICGVGMYVVLVLRSCNTTS
jgi:hypothetical protein